MESSYSLIYDIVINHIDSVNVFWTFYIANVVLSAIAYKLGFAKKLPILKSVVVYILLVIGGLILSFFSIVGYPITDSLVIICVVLGIYRFRLHRERSARQTS